ncbi:MULTISPECIES: ribosome maturation factor RimM [Methylomonas]|uniref:Ribosome maturation factor RimM n=1 Tax=Methylomonas koyamae TaxID=702114 RepID=A0A177N9I3_9GAMM|nr:MULTISPECIES: ribosome maturation factor RimM [Methylomonas]OAI14254.1 ribosome maturation factor RimM [Methylomonas koyamae]OHX38361.1 ribosome maturation factor RimM [Methylomonas sp. LWB]
MSAEEYLSVGQISGVFGIKGWVKVFSYTDPRENILAYSPWCLRKNDQIREFKVLAGRRQGAAVVAELEDLDDRDAAMALMGSEILIRRQQLPEPADGEYYWTDLIGLRVVNQAAMELGVVDHLLETGANDVVVVSDGQQERLIPFLMGQTILKVDTEKGCILVDWDADF